MVDELHSACMLAWGAPPALLSRGADRSDSHHHPALCGVVTLTCTQDAATAVDAMMVMMILENGNAV